MKRDRDLFLFQIYTGYYYKDLLTFSNVHLIFSQENNYLILIYHCQVLMLINKQ